jgi:hypothetical protein
MYETPEWLKAAEDNGHEMESDPPNVSRSVIARLRLTGRGQEMLVKSPRWTCTRCGCAALRVNGNIYGSATDRQCHLKGK